MEFRGTRRAALPGIVIGLVASTLGSLGIAVASFSGNVSSASGNEAAAVARVEHARGAVHTWYDSKSDGSSTSYVFGVWHSQSVASAAGAVLWDKGGVYATIERCEHAGLPASCTRQTWRGGLARNNGHSYQRFQQDTFLWNASFYGDLFDVETGAGCRFNVDFAAEQPQGSMVGPNVMEHLNQFPSGEARTEDERTNVYGHEVAPRTASFSRRAGAALASECWPALPEALRGSIWRNVRQLGV